jgi:hypothetical protein
MTMAMTSSSSIYQIDRLPPLDSLEWLQGSPADLTHNLRLLLLWQPNCPGCHSHALPLANRLASAAYYPNKSFDVYAISTAFEDFEYNTRESALLLLRHGTLVGAAAAAAAAARQPERSTTNRIPTLPLAHDIVVPKSQAPTELVDLAMTATKSNARAELSFLLLDQQQQHRQQQQQQQQQETSVVVEAALAQIDANMLPAAIAHIFYAVRAQGTPTWVLHTADGQVLDRRLMMIQGSSAIMMDDNERELLDWIADVQRRHPTATQQH